MLVPLLSTSTVGSSSNTTEALRVMRLTLTSRTPGRARMASSTWATQAAQVMPPTGRLIRRVFSTPMAGLTSLLLGGAL